MSVQAITYVLDHSEAKGSDRLVLIALANHACTEKGECWPSVRLLAREARLGERTVQYALRSLEHSRRVKRMKEPGQHGTVRRRLVFEPATEKDRPVLDPPKKGADLAPPEAEPEAPGGADPAPGADPAGAQSATSGGANDDAQGVQTSAPEPSRGTVREPSAAANAAAADASASSASTASAAGSSSGTEKPRDLGDVFYDRAAALLVHAGFEPAAVSADRLKIRTELRKHGETLPTVDWPVLAEQLKAGRADRTIYADTPIGVLAFGLRQRSRGHLVGGQVRPPVAAPGPAPASKIGPPPPPTDEAESAWTWLREQFAERIEGAGAWDTWLGAVAPLQVADGRTLEITGPPHAATWIEERLVPSLQSLCRASGADLRWVDPTDAAERSAA